MLPLNTKTTADAGLAESDYLTGLANRRGLYNYYTQLNDTAFIHAMYIDVDNFKRVNDIYGHSMGDKLLISLGHMMREYTNAFISRIGGDEYVLLFDGAYKAKDIEAIADKLISNLENIDFRKDILSLISLSVGIVLSQSAQQPLDDILSKCDAAMYQSKYDGKKRCSVYKEFDRTVMITKNIEREMDSALDKREFVVYLQPKVNMVTSSLCGAEALSRWEHPIDGTRSPAVYIPLFEKNGFISKLDMYIYEEVCRIKSEWCSETYAHIPISVNMSRLHLYNKDFPDTLKAIADKYGVDTHEIEIEITESVFIKDNLELIKMVHLLKDKGFLVSIDDFGSGFSALNLLKDIPVDTIKIDKEFLRLSADNLRGRKVIRHVIAMCRDLKLDVVTEGIETEEQIDFITSCGCQIAQGFFYSKPLKVEDFTVFASEHLTNTLSNYTFRLNGSLKSEDGILEGIIEGEGLYYDDGIFTDSKSLYFPGGPVEKNTVYLPNNTLINDSYCIALWIKPKEMHTWTSALYIKFENGFCSIVPLAWEGHSSFRIRDSREVNGWYDASACRLYPDVWTHFMVSYNAKTEKAFVYINGVVASILEHVPTNHFVKRIMLGGDIFQPSFIGNLCELIVYNEAKDYDFAKELYESYINDKKFNAVMNTHTLS